ncbi:MAG: UDP-N-acetylglucosamine 1-carboxyvinyltransferase, partial [bacterium]
MEKLIITGGRRLRGAVKVAGGKNSSLAIIASAALAADVSTLDNVPHCRDVSTLVEILEALGAQIEFTGERM